MSALKVPLQHFKANELKELKKTLADIHKKQKSAATQQEGGEDCGPNGMSRLVCPISSKDCTFIMAVYWASSGIYANVNELVCFSAEKLA